jgi:hypothetical protein
MLCCRRSSKYDPIDTAARDISKYPATRRTMTSPQKVNLDNHSDRQLIQTGGNALMEYDPNTMSDYITVVVPPDGRPGQMLQVSDESGRVAKAIVPLHCKPGSTFLMQFPSQNLANNADTNQTQTHELALKEEYQGSDDNNNNNNINNVSSSELQAVHPLKQRLLTGDALGDINISASSSTIASSNYSNSVGKETEMKMLITVPPGVDGGTTIYAKIPGDDNRYLPVKVPRGGVSQFYVGYVYGHTITESQMYDQDRITKIGQERKRQNWHDNPIAYGAPMIAAPLLL